MENNNKKHYIKPKLNVHGKLKDITKAVSRCPGEDMPLGCS